MRNAKEPGPTLHEIAIHEAGHVVMARVVGAHVTHIELTPDANSFARYYAGSRVTLRQTDWAAVSYAGFVGQRRVNPACSLHGTDLENFNACLKDASDKRCNARRGNRAGRGDHRSALGRGRATRRGACAAQRAVHRGPRNPRLLVAPTRAQRRATAGLEVTVGAARRDTQPAGTRRARSACRVPQLTVSMRVSVSRIRPRQGH